jgi:hypothetical protein
MIVALSAVAAIGGYPMFGETVKKQTGSMAAALSGDNGNVVSLNTKAGAAISKHKAGAEKNPNLGLHDRKRTLNSKFIGGCGARPSAAKSPSLPFSPHED